MQMAKQARILATNPWTRKRIQAAAGISHDRCALVDGDERSWRRTVEQIPGASAPEEVCHPAHGASITERPTAAARCECQFAVRHGKRPIADRGLMLTLARSNAIRVVGNDRLEVAVTVYICDR